MENIEIKHRFTGTVLFCGEYDDIRSALQQAVKEGVDLRGAYLGGAYLRGAYLGGADLGGAYLGGADLRGVDLRGVDLRGADLRGADLRGANLEGADLEGADLRGVDLEGAYLEGADLRGAKGYELIVARTRICAPEGALIGWKKLGVDVIAKLLIPADAHRTNAMSSRKCRASKVVVLEMFGAEEAFDQHTGRTLYRVGAEVLPDSFDPDVRKECTNGIHFFITREEAESY